MALFLSSLIALLATAPVPPPVLTAADRTAAFRAAGFAKAAGQWRKCDDPGTASYVPGTIEEVRDLNGDGLPEAVITESSSFCHGATGSGFDLVSKQANGIWQVMASQTGVPSFLARKGVAGWPDIEIGGPGFCFPVVRWDGKTYRQNRQEYQGKACRP